MSVVLDVVQGHWHVAQATVLGRAAFASGAHAMVLIWLSLSPLLGIAILCIGALSRARGWRATGLWVNLSLNHLALGVLYWMFVGLKIHGALVESSGFMMSLVTIEVLLLNGLVGVHYYRRAGGPDAAVLEEWKRGMGLADARRPVRIWVRCFCLACLLGPALLYLAIRSKREWNVGREGSGDLYHVPEDGKSNVA